MAWAAAWCASLSIVCVFLGLWARITRGRSNRIQTELLQGRRELAVRADRTTGGMASLARFVLGDPYVRSLDQKLMWAGRPGDWSGERVAAAQVGLAVAAFLVLGPVAIASFGPAGLLVGALGLAMGFFFPQAWVDRLAEQRQKAIAESLPAYMDLVALGVNAGLALPEAMRRVALRMDGPLADESLRTVQEMTAGTRSAALSAWAERTGVTGVARLAWVLHQAERYGTPVADVLREFARDLRRERALAVQARANALPVKIVFPLLFFGLGPILALLLVPMFFSLQGAFAF